MAHEDLEKEAAKRESQRVLHIEQQSKRDFALQRSLAQSYLATSQGWTVELQIFPEQDTHSHEVRLLLLPPHSLDDLTSASLLQMSSGKKFMMRKQGDYLMSRQLRFSQQRSNTLMLQIKTMDEQRLFFSFTH
ncbi:MAG: hypothetical protein Q9M19_05320 [Mariprofundaceae bacterium]|nr:hypothetical protein [Mariprofundaceae bacterium]